LLVSAAIAGILFGSGKKARVRKTTTAILWALLAIFVPTLVVPALGAGAAPQPYRMEPPSDWVSTLQLPLDNTTPVEEGESDYLLVEHQLRIAAITEHYVRFVERLVSQAEVDESAQIAIEIDPEHERVLLHDVHVVRDGRVIDKLADARRSLLNREEGLDQRIINGLVTLHVLLQDVRVGDVLDYSYTMERKDPFGERGYNNFFSTQWSSPVRHYRLRILQRADRPLQVSDHSQLPKPKVARKGEWLETTWTGKDIVALVGEEKRPSWFYFYPRIEISEFADWNAVRAWARPMYASKPADSAEFRALVADLKSEPDRAAGIVRALRFVQDDIRYTGLEIGAGAYRPTPPASVLKRRYGDCKDKVLLLVTLLRALGVEAYPALVNSSEARGVAERVSSPGAFDHVIAKMRWNDRDYWLDATASGQGGGLDDLVQADFGLALVLDGSIGGLEVIPTRQGVEPGEFVVESFDLRNGRDKTATFNVKTVYSAEEADAMRVKMRSTTATTMGKDYLEYYRKSYPGARMTKPLATRDNREDNIFMVEESYEIDKPFKKNKKGEWKFHLEAYLVTDRSKAPDKAERATPLARAFPMHVHHRIFVDLPVGWDIEEEEVKVSDPAFKYRSAVKLKGTKLQLDYDLRNTADHVTAAAFKRFAINLEKVNDDAYFTLTDEEHVAAEAPKPAAAEVVTPKGLSLQVIIAILAGLMVGFAVAYGVGHMRRRLPAATPSAPAGFEGWLVLPAIATLVLPFLMLQSLRFWFSQVGMAEQFARIGDSLQVIHLAEIFMMSLLLLSSIMTAALMIMRAHPFPFSFLATQALLVVAMAVDLLFEWKSAAPLPIPAEAVTVDALFAGIAVLAATYVLASQRVRATFVKVPRWVAD
jgi:transglutaminase-like putative cysteine protease